MFEKCHDIGPWAVTLGSKWSSGQVVEWSSGRGDTMEAPSHKGNHNINKLQILGKAFLLATLSAMFSLVFLIRDYGIVDLIVRASNSSRCFCCLACGHAMQFFAMMLDLARDDSSMYFVFIVEIIVFLTLSFGAVHTIILPDITSSSAEMTNYNKFCTIAIVAASITVALSFEILTKQPWKNKV